MRKYTNYSEQKPRSNASEQQQQQQPQCHGEQPQCHGVRQQPQPQKVPFVFPPSVQADLFAYLKPEQQEFAKPVLRSLKKPDQEELCVMLLDYMEQGRDHFELDIDPSTPVIFMAFMYLTQYSHSDPQHDAFPADPAIIRPLCPKQN